jgi:hypothetical protein
MRYQKRCVALIVATMASVSLLCQGFVSYPAPSRGKTAISMATMVNEPDLSELGLTPELAKYVAGFRSVVDDKLRYQQLFFLASKCAAMDAALKIEQNKVCLVLN